jgi:hypothetical protein
MPKIFSELGIFSSFVRVTSSSSLKSKYNSLKFGLRLKWSYFILSLILAVSLFLLDIKFTQYILLYWAFIVLPITEYWVTSASLSVGRSLFTGFHFLVFASLLDHYSVWNSSQIELYATLFCYYRISLTGLVSTNLVLFALLAYGTIHIVRHPEFSWPLLLHASWANRILHLSRTRYGELSLSLSFHISLYLISLRLLSDLERTLIS